MASLDLIHRRILSNLVLSTVKTDIVNGHSDSGSHRPRSKHVGRLTVQVTDQSPQLFLLLAQPKLFKRCKPGPIKALHLQEIGLSMHSRHEYKVGLGQKIGGSSESMSRLQTEDVSHRLLHLSDV